MTALKTYIDEQLSNIKDKVQLDYISGQCKRFLALKPKQGQLKVQLNKMRDQVYTVNVPKKHAFKLEFKK